MNSFHLDFGEFDASDIELRHPGQRGTTGTTPSPLPEIAVRPSACSTAEKRHNEREGTQNLGTVSNLADPRLDVYPVLSLHYLVPRGNRPATLAATLGI